MDIEEYLKKITNNAYKKEIKIEKINIIKHDELCWCRCNEVVDS